MRALYKILKDKKISQAEKEKAILMFKFNHLPEEYRRKVVQKYVNKILRLEEFHEFMNFFTELVDRGIDTPEKYWGFKKKK